MNISPIEVTRRLRKEEHGGVSLKGVMILIIIALVIYAGVSYIPAIQTPIDLDKAVVRKCKDYLQTPGRLRDRARKILKPAILEAITITLEGHSFLKDDLKVEIDRNDSSVSVTLPYSLNLNIIGFQLNVDKTLKVRERYTRF